MRLMFIGADHEVTGSCHYLEACGKKMLIDCGMEQGSNDYENQEIPVSPAELDYVLLTHAHIDHSGMLPLLYAKGFRGIILTTSATCDLCEIMLRDSAHIQMMEAEWKNRKQKRAGGEVVEPVYNMEDAEGAIRLFSACEYGEILELAPGLKVRYMDVGHLLGSASIEIWMTEGDITKKIAFSGDIGNTDQPLIRDPQYLKDADYVVMESTYGDRIHSATVPDYVEELAELIRTTLGKGGNLVIPSFAVGRTQEMLYFLRKVKMEHKVPEIEDFDVFVDSPLAIEATNVFQENRIECFDEEAMEMVHKGINPISFPGLKLSVSTEESRNINFDSKPKVIISASGMCEAGRIRHHLKHNLWRPECTILFVGYQAKGTLGRTLLDGVDSVKLFGEVIEVDARIERLDGISGHADRNGLTAWVKAFDPKPKKVFVVHGEDQTCDQFCRHLENTLGLDAEAPFSGSIYDLASGAWVKQEAGIPIVKSFRAKQASGVFGRLIAAGERLRQVILHNEGGANKDLARFADQINSLCDKWDR